MNSDTGTMSSPLASLREDERQTLDSLGFDAEAFGALAEQLRSGSFPSNQVEGELSNPSPTAIQAPAPTGSMQGDALVDAGLQLLDRGGAGLLLLNGGMATRFGGRVKAVVEAIPGRSFLALQAGRMASLGRGASQPAPLLLMNSNATDATTDEHLEQNHRFGMAAGDIFTFVQSAAPRLRPDGSLFRDERGKISVYGPGHGDLVPSLQRSGALDWLAARGTEILLMGNVDNLGAALDPQLLGHFLASGADMMVEVVERLPGEPGGAPCSVDGRIQLVEDFAFPETFPKQGIPWFNTNTLWFRTDALARELPLRWYFVQKMFEGESVIQFERLVGQVTWYLDTCWVPVSRERFLPVKTPEDLETLQPRLSEMFRTKLSIL